MPGVVLGLRAAGSPNEKLNLAGIGIGGQGGSDLGQMESENIVALCDVDQQHAAHIFKKYPKAKQFTDYRRMLDEMKEIDGVVIATPDHHHAFASMEAFKRGKHVYCEKPLTHSVWEARRVAQAAREAKVATQMGNQGQASEETRRLCEHVWAGVIGNVREAHIWTDRPSRGLFEEYWPQGLAAPQGHAARAGDARLGFVARPGAAAALQPGLPAVRLARVVGLRDGRAGRHRLPRDGPGVSRTEARRAAERAGRFHSRERGDLPAGLNGYLGIPRAVGRTASHQPLYGQPHRGCGGRDRDAGLQAGLVRRRAAPSAAGWFARWRADGRQWTAARRGQGFHSRQQGLSCGRGRRQAAKIPSTIPRSAGHYEEWIAACKGGAPAGSNFDWAGPLAESVLLGNVALRVQLREDLTLCKLLWDGPGLKFTNLADANHFVRRDYRAGWSL